MKMIPRPKWPRVAQRTASTLSYAMENVALERLQERQERVMLLVEALGEEDISVLSSNAP